MKKEALDIIKLLPYVGGKRKLWLEIYTAIRFVAPHDDADTEKTYWNRYEYREPFIGGGSVFLNMVSAKRAWLNDWHSGVACLWTAARDYPDKLLDQIGAYKKPPDEATFRRWKRELKREALNETCRINPEKASEEQILNHGLMTIATTYLSWSNVQRETSYRPNKWSVAAMTKNRFFRLSSG